MGYYYKGGFIMALNKKERKLPKGIYLHQNGYYLGRFQYLGDKYEVYDKELKTCIQMLEDKKYEVRHGLFAKTKNIAVRDWFQTWIKEYKELNVKEGTIQVYKDAYRLYIEKAIGNKKINTIRGEHIQKIYNDLKRKGYSKSTLEIVATVLSGMFKQAMKNELISKNPVVLATLPKQEEKAKVKVMSLEEEKLFLEYAKESWLYTLIFVALFSGMRSGELRALRWKDIDFSNKLIHVRKSLLYLNKDYKIGLTKTKSSVRDIPMLDIVEKTLRQHKKEQLERKMLLGDKWKAKEGMEDLVFPSDTGYPMNRDRLKVQVNKIVDAIRKNGYNDFPHITPHVFRHTFATRCIESGVKPSILQKVLGHSKISQTMDLYVHALPDAKFFEMQKIANII